MTARFAVGIDLGTTNTVAAFAPLDDARDAEVFRVSQLVSPREAQARPLLPSMLYAPPESERLDDPFHEAPWVLGEVARQRGAEVPGRLVSSSKSWLVHASVDRAAPILPWGSSADVPKLSPVEAAARLLTRVRRAWDASHAEAPLSAQQLVVTVPASFDDVARGLTLEAARNAGLDPKLLEEPQAAFYDWVTRAGWPGLEGLLHETGGRALVLIVDVGGGTTDLSLVSVDAGGAMTRVAVGPHLLLGGDNMDLALAHELEPRLVEGADRLDAARFAQLVASCRLAKESLLGSAAGEDAPVAVAGGGSSLVGSARTTRLTRAEAERVVLEGFLPAVAANSRPERTRGALLAFGLPYVRDVAITRHVSAFLDRHLPEGTWPNAVLLNGGVFRASRVAERLIDVVASWRGGRVVRLPDADPDLAVARGAVAYAQARLGRRPRIRGGTARGYFVGIDAAPSRRAVCVVPRGAEEGDVHAARGRSFALVVGRPVRFDLFASDTVDAAAGDVVDVDDERFERLPPVATTVDSAVFGAQASVSGGDVGELHVTLEGELTPVGTVDLGCVDASRDPPRRFSLAFQLRRASVPAPPTVPPPSGARLGPALDLIERAFGKARADASGREAKDLVRELERMLGERTRWTTDTNRALFDALLANDRGRRRSADHERAFWMLAGWCARPGFGASGDADRAAALARLFEERLAFSAEVRGWQAFWVAIRRVAPGFGDEAQRAMRDFVDPHLGPREAGLKRPKKAALSLEDALDMASSLERVASERRAELGGWVLERTWTDRDPRLWLAVGRLGARVPAYASVHHVVASHVAERWLDHLLREKWDVVPTAVTAALQLARPTGDRARDVPERVRREVERRLVAAGVEGERLRAIREVVAVSEEERVAFFGDSLPVGLRLVE